MKKTFDISSGSKSVGKVSIDFKIAIDWDSSEIHREFYTKCTKVSDAKRKLAESADEAAKKQDEPAEPETEEHES